MMISRCKFLPPSEDRNLVDVLVSFDGAFVVLGSIYKEQNISMKASKYIVAWDSITYFEDEYLKKVIESEIVERYFDWRENICNNKDLL